MAVLESADAGPEPGSGAWLVVHRRLLDAGEAVWLEALGRFDEERLWADDGQLSCAEWLMAFAGMGRSSAFERVRVARQLRVRPVLAAAYGEGRLSYCALRAITRATDAVAATDEALVTLAGSAPVIDVETAVRAYQLYRSQELPPVERRARRGLRIRSLGDGMCALEAVVTDVEAAELDAVLGRIVTAQSTPTPSTPTQSTRGDRAAGAAGESSRVDQTGVVEGPGWAERRVDAFCELVRSGPGRWVAGADRHLVHMVVTDGEARLLGGPVLAPGERDRICCDASTVVHVHRNGAPLAVGRRRRTWNVAQRRAVLVRDGGRCRWPGCQRTHVDVHHVQSWEAGGRTDIDNGIALCPRHHTRIHDGYATTGTAHGELVFHRPDGTRLGASRISP